jgi:prepilin-type N-terminal cleavage/methylation domain-containing protein
MNVTRTQSGFTLVEMIVSLAIFAIVVTVSVGALLVLVGTNQRLQGEQSVMTNLSFALDSMTREIRTGSSYYCVSEASAGSLSSPFNPASNLDTVFGQSVLDCASGNNGNARYHGMAFVEGGDSISGTSNRILYFYDEQEKNLYRRVGSGPAQSIVSPEVHLIDFEFFVTGSENLQTSGAAATRQPTVTIYIRASENADGSGKQFDVQTTVTQRTLDV